MPDAAVDNSLLALLQDSRLPSYIRQSSNDMLISIHEPVQRIRDPDIVAELLNQLLRLAEVMPGNAGVEVVNGLELKATVEEVQPLRAVNVHGGAQHALREGLVGPQVRGRHGEVGKRDLHVQRAGDGVRDHEENEAVPVAVDGLVHDPVPEPVPKENLPRKLEMAVPPRRTMLGGLALQEILPREAVEVQSGEHHDDVVEIVLQGDEESGSDVVLHDTVIVGGPQVGEETVRDGKEGQMFDIRIVLGTVGDNMVHVVIALPPAQTQPTDEVCNDDADDSVDMKVVRDTHVASVVGSEDQLMPERAKTEGARDVPAPFQEQKTPGEEEGIAESLDGVRNVVAVVESCGLDAFVEFTILPDHCILGLLVKGRVLFEVEPDLLPR